MNCDTCSKQLSAYIDDVLTIEEMTAIAHHLETCTACQEALEMLYALRECMQDVDAIKLPEGFHEALMQKVAQTPQEEMATPAATHRIGKVYRYGAGLAAAAMCFFALRSLPGQHVIPGEGAQGPSGISVAYKETDATPFQMASPTQNRTVPQQAQWSIQVSDQEASYTLLVDTLIAEGYVVEGVPFEGCLIHAIKEEQVVMLTQLIEETLGGSVHNGVQTVDGTVQVLLETME